MPRTLRRRSDWAAIGLWMGRGLIVALALLSVLAVRATVLRFPLRAEAGYGDSYILHDVQALQKTGRIYRDPDLPPYLPSQYSPLTYVLLSLPGPFVDVDSPFVGPRILVIGAFLGCVALAWSITRRLAPVRAAGCWAMLLIASISTFWWWPLQIRADFPAVCCSLAAIRALLSRRPRAVIWAGLAAGLAVQFKVTFVAAGVAGILWLGASRDWQRLWAFSLAGATTSIGGYAVWALREPRMFAQILALSPGVPDLKGAIGLLGGILTLPALVLAMIGLGTFSSHVPRSWRLVLGFYVVAFAVGGITSVQAGANVNYYFESLFAAVPFAVRGLLRFPRLHAGRAAAGTALLTLAGLFGAPDRLSDVFLVIKDSEAALRRDEHARLLAPILAPRHTLATVPWVAMLDSHPTLVEPYLLSYLTQLGSRRLPPLPAAVRSREFAAVFTAHTARSWRGIPHITASLRSAIAGEYIPYCVLGEVLTHLPAQSAPDATAFAAELRGIGCRPLAGHSVPPW